MPKTEEMTDIQITITLNNVLTEVGRLTNYMGRKKDSGSEYERISTTESDQAMLSKFWEEACDIVTENAKQFIKSQTLDQTSYVVTITPSASFDTTLDLSLKRNVNSFVVKYVVCKWYKLLTNNEESDSYARESDVQLTEAMSKLYYKKKPTRTKPV